MGTSFVRLILLSVVLSLLGATAYGQNEQSVAQTDAGALQRVTLQQYHAHLQQLQDIVQDCAAKRSLTACDAAKVGADEVVSTPGGLHQVHYAWLRKALTDAATPRKASHDNAAAYPLAAALQRLNAAQGASSVVLVGGVRKNLEGVLARREFARIEQPGFLQRAQSAAWEWFIQRLLSMASFGKRNAWMATVLEWLAIGVVCVVLMWWLLRRLGRQTPLAAASAEPAAPTAPSAREWRRWLEDAEAFSRQGQWREAVHHVYWAAISRMESQGLWPADRARTPREYVRMLHAQHALLPDLRRLTRSFERIWYGHRPAEEEQYREAHRLMERLSIR